MTKLRVNDILKDPVLVSRESAHLLEDAIRSMISEGLTSGKPASEKPATPSQVIVDFDGVAGVAPSFVDELIIIIETLLAADANGMGRGLMIENPPTRLSSKFEAIARGHGMSVRALENGSWLLAVSGPANA